MLTFIVPVFFQRHMSERDTGKQSTVQIFLILKITWTHNTEEGMISVSRDPSTAGIHV